jgi:hypothetical protein
MEEKIIVKGVVKFMGIELPEILGGFAEDKKAITDKHISQIHKQPAREIRRRIKDNINRFKEGIDYIDLKDVGDSHNNLELLLTLSYTKMEIAKAEHIYLLSERGYAKLIKILDTDLAWEIHDKLIDEYFAMKEIINNLTKEEELALQVFHGGLDAIGACKELNKINYNKGFLEGVKNERMSQLITTSSLCKLIKVPGLTSQIFYRFLNFRNLGNLKRVKKNYKFVPNEKFNDVMVVNGWAKSISTTSTQVRFYSDLADIINDNAMYLQQLEDIKYYYVDLLKAGDDEDADLPF